MPLGSPYVSRRVQAYGRDCVNQRQIFFDVDVIVEARRTAWSVTITCGPRASLGADSRENGRLVEVRNAASLGFASLIEFAHPVS